MRERERVRDKERKKETVDRGKESVDRTKQIVQLYNMFSRKNEIESRFILYLYDGENQIESTITDRRTANKNVIRQKELQKKCGLLPLKIWRMAPRSWHGEIFLDF